MFKRKKWKIQVSRKERMSVRTVVSLSPWSFYVEVCAAGAADHLLSHEKALSDANRFVSGRFKRFTIIRRTQIQLTPCPRRLVVTRSFLPFFTYFYTLCFIHICILRIPFCLYFWNNDWSKILRYKMMLFEGTSWIGEKFDFFDHTSSQVVYVCSIREGVHDTNGEGEQSWRFMHSCWLLL